MNILLDKLVNSFSKLPGVGKKTAIRYAYSVLNMSDEDVTDFSSNLILAKKNIKFCKECGNWSDRELCPICLNRSHRVICVVKEPKDVMTIEKTQVFNGTYHVLHGTISPQKNLGPNDIRIKELLQRISTYHTEEVIMATNPDVEGEATSMYIAGILKPLGIKVTRLAQGISFGSDIEYQDELTLSKALEERKII